MKVFISTMVTLAALSSANAQVSGSIGVNPGRGAPPPVNEDSWRGGDSRDNGRESRQGDNQRSGGRDSRTPEPIGRIDDRGGRGHDDRNRDQRGRDPGRRGDVGRGHPGRGPIAPPPSYDRWDHTYGPSRTVAWKDLGKETIPKFIGAKLSLRVRGDYVNEILFKAEDNDVEILEAFAELSNGQMINLQHMRGRVREKRDERFYVDRYYSLRMEKLHLTVVSPSLSGSRGELRVLIGVSR